VSAVAKQWCAHVGVEDSAPHCSNVSLSCTLLPGRATAPNWRTVLGKGRDCLRCAGDEHEESR
jgi:hypothetical protein